MVSYDPPFCQLRSIWPGAGTAVRLVIGRVPSVMRMPLSSAVVSAPRQALMSAMPARNRSEPSRFRRSVT